MSMVCFVVGCEPTKPEAQSQFMRMLQEVEEYEGLERILMSPDRPWKAVLCFKDQESATAAQWMLDLNGSQPAGGAEEGGTG